MILVCSIPDLRGCRISKESIRNMPIITAWNKIKYGTINVLFLDLGDLGVDFERITISSIGVSLIRTPRLVR